MLEFYNIDKDFKVYSGKKVYLFGASRAGRKVKEILENRGVAVSGFIDNDVRKHGREFCGVEVISFDDFVEMHHANKDTLIQISSTHEDEIVKQLKEAKIKGYITYSEFYSRTWRLGRYLSIAENDELRDFFYERDWQKHFFNSMDRVKLGYFEMKHLLDLKSFNIMVSPPKVGNTSINNSLNAFGKRVAVIEHSFEFLSKELPRFLKDVKTKLIVGVRDPISQNLSLEFQVCVNSLELWDVDEFWAGGAVFKKFLTIIS